MYLHPERSSEHTNLTAPFFLCHSISGSPYEANEDEKGGKQSSRPFALGDYPMLMVIFFVAIAKDADKKCNDWTRRRRRYEDLFEHSESRSTVWRNDILSSPKRATSSLFGCFFSPGGEKKNVNNLSLERWGEGEILAIATNSKIMGNRLLSF